MKIKILGYVTVVLLIASMAVASNQAEVSSIHLSPQPGETVLKIDVNNGPFQYSHETAEAKGGKPFRVVIDIFPAVHDLGQKDFAILPPTIISTIRTSQYSTNPENIVRIVCDLDQTVMYRVEKKENSIYLYLPDKNRQDFASWSSPEKAPATVARIDSDQTEKPVQKAASDKPAVSNKTDIEKPKQVVPKEANVPTQQTASLNSDDKPIFVLAQPFETQKSTVPDREKNTAAENNQLAQKTDESQNSSMKSAPVKTEDAKKSNTPAKTNKSTDAKLTIAKNPESTKKNDTPVIKVSKEEPQKTSSVADKPSAESPKVASAEANTSDNSNDNQKPTSRFRRKPSFPNKLKGTIVAEFPKRIVMKYEPGTSRDPFENLLKSEKNTNSPIEKRIPDVETSKLVGVLESTDGEMRALLEDHDGYGYILKSGDKIKKGYVGKIYSDKAYFRLFEYGWSRTVALYMNLN